MISGQWIGFPAERWQRFCPSRNASKFEEGAGFAAKASSPQVLGCGYLFGRQRCGYVSEPAHQREPRGRHSPGSGEQAPGWLLPFRVRGQSTRERQDPRRPPAGAFPSPAGWGLGQGHPGAWGSSSPGTQGASLQLGGETRGRFRRWGRGGCRRTRLWPRPPG